MKSLSFREIELIPWYAFGIYWIVGAIRTKSAKRIEPIIPRLLTIFAVVLTFSLLFSDWPMFPFLDRYFLQPNLVIRWAGVALTTLGAAIAIWARTKLGSNWSAEVGVKQGHELIQSGPYAYVRHPIYTGLLVAIIGTALVICQVRGLLAIAVILLAHSLKARREEALMAGEFGERYKEYRKKTGFLFPKF
jgi:protein-S-isoprenylcysteine O-methyltransferase Ste14